MKAKLKKLLCLFSFCEKKGQRRRREKEKQKQERVCSSRKETFFSLSLSLAWKRTHQTHAEKKQFSAEKTKKKHRYLAIKLTHVDTLYSLKHSHTHNVLCYPIRCCAIRSLERRFQEKRQSSVSRGGVVLVLLMFFVRIVLF